MIWIAFALTVWLPAEIAGLRVATAAVALAIAVFLRGERLPSDWRHWRMLGVIAVIGNCLPFFLISWGQQYLESGLAGILTASTPLFVLIMAHFALDDERLGPRHMLAFALGFAGIVVLLGPDSLAALGGSGTRLMSQFAILGAAACYGSATVFARKLPEASAVVTAAGVMLAASLIMTPFIAEGAAAFGADAAAFGADVWTAAAAIGFVGVLGTGIASIIYFRLIAETGARFTSLLNYLVPVWAVALGAVVLGEQLPVFAWLGLFLVLGGLIVIPKSGMIARQNDG